MGKKAPAQIVIEEEEDDEQFDDFSFEEDSQDDEAPQAVNRVALKKLPIAKQTKGKKDKKKPKKANTVIRGGDIFAEALPEEEVSDLKTKQAQAVARENQEREVEEKRQELDRRNQRVEREAKRRSANHIIFENKNTGKKYMLANKRTLEHIEPVSSETSAFLRDHLNRLKRVPLNSII